MNRLILLVESRIRGDVYVRFGGELPKTHRSNTAGRWMLSLPFGTVQEVVSTIALEAYKKNRQDRLFLRLKEYILQKPIASFTKHIS